MAKTALAKDPKSKDKKPKPQSAWEKEKTILSQMAPGDPKFDAQVKRVQDAGKKQGVRAEIISAITRRAQSKQGVATAGTTEPTLQELAEAPLRQGAAAYEDLMREYQQFDPYQMQQKYQQGFGQEMDRARQSLMQQFERRNTEQFAREREATQQSIVERGLDPNSPAAQAMMRDLNDRQDRARQEAMTAAEQAAYGVQEQGFGQAYKTAMAPYEQWGMIQGPYTAGLAGQYASQQLEQQQGYDIAKLRETARLQQQGGRSGGGGGGGGNSAAERALAELIMRGYGPQSGGTEQPSAGQAAATGLSQGVMLGVANRR